MNISEYISSGIVELYVMGLCSDKEKMEMEKLRLQYPELNEAIKKYEHQLENNLQSQAILPSAETDSKILDSFDTMPAILNNNSSAAVVKRTNRSRIFAAAAVFLVVVSGFFLFTFYKKNRALEEQLAGSGSIHDLIKENKLQSTLPMEDYKVMLDPKITPVAMYGVGSYTPCRCTMFWDKKTGKVHIIIHHLPLSSSSEDYQLWAIVNETPVSVGTIRDEIRGRFIELNNIPGEATSFIVTLEKAGGSTTPNYKETYLSGKI